MKHLNFLSSLDSWAGSHRVVTSCTTVGSPSVHRRGAMLKLLSVLVLILTIGVGQMWGARYSLTPDQASTGSSATAYITTLTEFTYPTNGISWKMNQWNPKTLQIKANQSSAASEFRFYNTSAFAGKITKVVVSFSALTVSNQNGLMFLGGTSEQSGTSSGTAGTWNNTAKTLTWTPASNTNYTYFAFYQNGKVASGTNYLVSSDAIVVTYLTAVTLNKNGGSANGAAKFDHEATAYATSSFTPVTRSNYNCTGYWTASSGGTKILNADGSIAAANITVNTVPYTDANKKWVYTDGTLTLYAQWESAVVETPTITPSVEELDWGTVNKGTILNTKTFTITGSNLTAADLVYTANGGYSVSPSGKDGAAGTLAVQTLTVTPPSTATPGTYNSTVTISGGGLSSAVSVAVKLTVLNTDQFIDELHGTTGYTSASPHIEAGSYGTTPTITDKAVATSGTCAEQHYHFVGWITKTKFDAETAIAVGDLQTPTSATGAIYYAVWAKKGAGGDVTDVIDHDKVIGANASIGSNGNSTWATATLTGFTSGAQYFVRSMGLNNSTDYAIRWNGNGYLYSSTAPSMKLKSITVTTTGDKSVDIYGATSAYSAAATETSLNTLAATSSGATYDLTSAQLANNYTCVGVNGKASSTEVVSISITYSNVSYTDYRAVCCNELGAIGGSVSLSQTSATLTWNDLANVAASNPYEVTYRTGDAAYGKANVGSITTNDQGKKTCTITGLNCGTAYDFKIAVTAAAGYCDAEQVLEDQSTTKWNISYSLGGTVNLSEGPEQGANACGEISATFSKNALYTFPDEITVTIGGDEATVDDDYLWDAAEGTLYIDAAHVIGNVAVTITGVAPANPSVTPDPTALIFSQVKKGADVPAAKDIALEGHNLTAALTVTSSNTSLYVVSVKSGSLTPDGNKDASPVITVTPQAGITSTAGDKNATITISGGGLASDVVVNVTFNVQETYTVNWYINNDVTRYAYQTDVAGTTLNIPSGEALNIDDCSDASLTFVGWSENAIGSTPAQSKPTFAEIGSTITANKSYYAVFAAGEAGGYAKVTAENQLAANDKVVITYNDSKGMKAYDGSSTYYEDADITFNEDKLTSIGDACEFTLGGTTDAWTFFDGTYYVYSAGSPKSKGYNNYMQGQTELTNAGRWKISIEDGITSITTDGNTDTPNMRYNTSSPRFSCYNSGQSAVDIYRKTADTYNSWVTVCPHAYIVTLAPATNGNGTITFAKNASAITEIETTGSSAVTVDVEAHPATGFELTSVALSSEDVNVGQGGASYSNNVITIPANEEGTLTATATFGKVNYAVSYTAPSNGSYTIKVGDAAAVNTNTTAQYGQTITLAVVSEAEGYLFNGWSVTKTASSTAIAVDGNNQFTMPAEAVTVAANFQAIPSDPAVVTFNAGAGELDCNACTNSTLTEESAGAGITLPSCTPATGYAFLGWTATQNKETIDDGAVSGATYLPAGDMPLYAVYTQLTAVTLKKGNGTTTDEVLYADVTTGKVTLTSRSSKNQNYTFAGWSTKHYSTEQEDANPSIIEAGEYTPGADITLYPVFSVQVPVTIWTKKTVAQVDGAGTYAIIDEDGYAFNGSISSGHGQGTAAAFSFTNNVATSAPTGTCELTFTAVEGGYTLYNEDLGYLYATKAASGGLAWHAEEDSYWNILTDGDDNDWLYNWNSAYLRTYVSNQSHTFRTYSGNGNGNDLYFAKKENQNVTKYNAAPANDVAAPTFSPVAGAYYGAQNVTINCATDNVTIYYTDDDSDPDENSTEYESAISVSSSKTIKAVAIDEDGYSSTIAEAAYTIYPVYNSIAAYQAASAQEAATARVNINKESANAIVIGVTGSYTYVQDGTAAMIIKRPNSESPLTVGYELNGYVQGTRSTNYGLPMITVENIDGLTSEAAGTPITAQTVSNLDFAGAWSSYAGNLIKVEDVYFKAQATSDRTVALADGAKHTGAIYDALYKMAGADLPVTNTACDVTGVLVARTVENETTYYIAPTSTEDISTKGAVAQLDVNPIGGANAGSAVGIAPGGQVTVTPVEGFATTLNGVEINTVSTVPVTELTSITVSATRPFYAANEQTYYYDVDASYMSVTVNQPTNVGGSTISASPTSAQEGNTITLSYNLAAHYHFNGWNVYKTGESGTTVPVTNNQFEMPSFPVTVEAEIEEDAYANVLFANGGATSGAVPTDANKYYVGNQVTMPGKNTLAKSGSTFAGWSRGGNDYEEGDPYTILAADAAIGGNDITFTALWTPYPWGGNGKWELVTDKNEITVSPATYVIFADTLESSNNACGETQNTNNRATVGVSITDGILTWTGSSPAVFTVEAGNVENTFAFYDAINGNYIHAASDSKNYLYSNASKATSGASWTIEAIRSNGGATVTSDTYSHNMLQVNGNVCAAYQKTSPQKGLAIYKFVAGNYYNINYAVGDVDEPEEVTHMPATQVTANDGTATLLSDIPVYVGKLFQNWKDEEADQTYEPGANVTLTQNVTLTAQWIDATAHSLSYDLNGGTLKEGSAAIPDPDNYYPGAEVTVTTAVLEKEDVIFIGWEYNGDIYGAGASFTMPNKAVTLTAKFAKGAIYTVATASSVSAQGAPEGSTAIFANTYTSNKEQITKNNSMTLTLSGYKGYLIKNITLSMHSNGNDGAGTFSATVGSNSVASIASATTFNNWYDNNSYGTSYRDVHVTMTDYPAVGAAENVEIVIAATTNSLYCQSFTIEYEVAPVEINDTESIEASDILPGADVTVNDGGTLVIDETSELDNLTVEAGGTVSGSAALTVNDLTIKTSLGTISGDDNDGGKSGEISNSNINATGDVWIEIELTQASQASFGWYAFSVPFPVNTMNGVYYQNTQLQNEVGYAIMAYHEEERAAGKYAWKKYRETNLVPGMLYIITVGDTDYKTLRFKKAQGTDLIASSTVPVSYTTATGEGGASGWNGVGNPNLQVSHQNDYTYLQFLDHDDNCFRPRTADKTDLLVGTAFMVQVAEATENITIDTGANDGEGNIALAPARTPKAIENTIFEVKLRNAATGKTEDNLFFTAREDATNEYEIGRDVAKMSMGNAKCAQMWIPAYGTQLCAADFPLINDKATYPLIINAPSAGTYTIAAPNTEDATLYLTKNGYIIWNLTMSECEVDLTQGQNNEYGLVLRAGAPQTPTGVENGEMLNGANGVQKVIIDEQVFILRGGEMYDVTGKMVR